ncbi:MAG: hypothetical protein FWH27_07920 [Planctomycetaceae bacterium]|nr:hypothetical protein [Planctomycetaceae bacterium]
MRLSLKTILAYTDNLFDTEYRPAVEKRIGEEGVAGYLMDRIRAVVSSPDILVPGRCGEKEELSVNLVAAYFDNLLSDTEQTQFETICLRSDIYLAEVACTHQILTTILGQPAKLNRDCRLRLYAIPRHRKELPTDVPVSHESVEVEQEMAETQFEEPAPRKNRRITVTVQENSVMQTSPSQESHEVSPESQANQMEQDGQIEQVDQPDQPTITVRSVSNRISRLGQAFAHQKRHRQVMMISSLVLMFLCASIYLIAHIKPRQPKNEVAQHRPRATPTGIVALEDDHDNNRHFDEHHGLWQQRDMASSSADSGVAALSGGEMVASANPLYSFHDSPGAVMQYLPGEGGALSQVPYSANMTPGSSPPFPQQPVAAQSPTIQPGQPQPVAPMPPLSVAQQNPLLQPNSQAVNTQVNVMATAATARPNSLPVGQNPTNLQFGGHYGVQPSAQPTQRQPESTIQFIDRGNVPSVNQFINPTLPAVQPPTWETGGYPEGANQTTSPATNHQATFPYYMQAPGALTNLPDGTDQAIEQASYTPRPRQPNQPPPLIDPMTVEPDWTESRDSNFEQVNIASHAQPNRDASPPLRLPENSASRDESHNRPQMQHRIVPNGSMADSGFPMLLLSTEDLVLVRDTPDSEWSWLPVSKQLDHDIVLVPAPFRAAFRFPNGIVVETEGDTRVRILPDDEAGLPALAFDCGHLTIYATRNPSSNSNISQSLRIVTPVGGGVLRLTDTDSFVTIASENKTTVKLLKVTRPYESVTANPVFYRSHLETNVVYCPNLMTFPANGKTIYWQKDGYADEWKLGTASIFPIDLEKSTGPILLYNTTGIIVSPAVVWPALVSHDGRIPISKIDLKNQFVTMPHTFYPTPSKTWLLK